MAVNFDEFQLENIEDRRFITQRESKPGVPDTAALPYLRKDINSDGNGFDPQQRFTEHMFDGADAPDAVALVGDEGTFGGNFILRYDEIGLDMAALFGKSAMVSKTTLPDGRTKEVWKLSHGPRDIETVTAWFGYLNRCWLLRYGKIMTWVIESDRTGETGGNKAYHFNEATRNQSEPDAAPQNAKFTVSGTDVAGPLGLNITQKGGAASVANIAFPATLAQIKTALQTALGAGSNVNVTGAGLVAAGLGAGAVANPTTAPTASGGPPFSGTNGNYKVAYTFYTADGETALGPLASLPFSAGTGASTVIAAPPAVTNAAILGYRVYMETAPGSNILLRVGSAVNTAAGNNFSGGTVVVTAPPTTGSAAAPTSSTTVGSGGTPAYADFTAEIISPATRFAIAKGSGDVDYVVTQTQLGSDGSGVDEIGGPKIEPNHWLNFKAPTKAALDAIDMGDADTPVNEDQPELIKTATAHSFSMENLAQAIYLEDGKVNPGAHITRRPTIGGSLTLAVQTNEDGQDFAEDIYATENLGGCGVTPFWWRQRARCDGRELWIDLYCSRNAAAEHPAQEGLAQWQFPLIRRHNNAGSLFITRIYPASAA